MIDSVVCYFDGQAINGDDCVITDIKRPMLPDWVLNTVEVPGRDGTRFLGQRRGPLEISVTFAMWAKYDFDLHERVRQMSAILAVDEPKKLTFSDNRAVYYDAIPQGVTDFEQLDAQTGRFTVTFAIPDGYANGKVMRKSVGASVREVRFNMRGTVKCPLKITVPGATGNITFADSFGNYCTVACPSTARDLVIDGRAGTVTHGTTTLMMSLNSDFLYAYPGDNIIYEQVGTKAFTVEYQPRW